MALVGISKEYQNKGINEIILVELLKMLSNKNVEYAETNLNLEDNVNVQNQWKNFDNVLYKKRRSFMKRIE